MTKREYRLVVYLDASTMDTLKARALREARPLSTTAARLIVKELKRLEK